MQTGNGQLMPKYRASADVYALKIKSVVINEENRQATVTFDDSYYLPATMPAVALKDLEGDGAGSYLVAEGSDWTVIPAERFEAHFKRVEK
jgi:hypothetical protein